MIRLLPKTHETTSPTVKMRVEHVDIDSYGIVHFSRYSSLLETAILELLSRSSLSLELLMAQGLEPRISELSIKFRQAATYGDVLTFVARAIKQSPARITFEVIGTCDTAQEQNVVVIGYLTMAVVRRDNGAPRELPPFIINYLDEKSK
ncbi:MAG TPA: thioesterase family protein [Pyrinomonadaceae bacterium]|nr:thioesterase family protein [Pyrinomonadaceae bacterium]